MVRPATDPTIRFFKHVDKTSSSIGCWLWTGFIRPNGYAAFRLGGRDGKHEGVHRYSYQLYKGLIPHGFHIDHLCSVRHCVNPDHLEAVTPKENNQRSNSPSSNNGRKTHCPQGHPYKGEHLYIAKDGRRYCMTCIQHRKKQRREALKILGVSWKLRG